MKRFKYKLNTILKLREFEKKKVEIELGQINKKVKDTEDLIEDIYIQIKTTQEDVNRSDSNRHLDNSLIKYFPQFLKAKNKEIEIQKEKLQSFYKERNSIIEHLNEVSGKYKILEKDKEKKKQVFLKEQMKKEELSREDLQIILRGRVS